MKIGKLELLASAALMLAPHAAWAAGDAADTGPAANAPNTADIIVTGSRSVRRDLTSPSPIVT